MKKYGIEVSYVGIAPASLAIDGSCSIRQSWSCVQVAATKVPYMTTHQHDSSQPQQSHSSPQERTGEGLMIEETEEAVLPGMVTVESCS